MRVRREKLDRLRADGIDPYPLGFPRTTEIATAAREVPRPRAGRRHRRRVGITGRVMLSRIGGKLCFATLRDGTGDLQVMLSLDKLGEESLARWKAYVDLGDHVGVTGEVITSRRGELSVLADVVGPHGQVAAPAAREAQGPRPRAAGPAALRRPHRQPGRPPDAQAAQRRRACRCAIP